MEILMEIPQPPSQTTFSRLLVLKLALPIAVLSLATALWLDGHEKINFQPVEFNHLHTPNSSTIFLGIISVIGKYEQRQAIRQSWLHRLHELDPEMQHRFFVACPAENQTCWQLVSQEYHNHKDLIAISMVDSYKNVSLKVVGSLFWPLLCVNSSYYYDYHLKVDEDVYVDAEKLFNYYRQLGDGRSVAQQIGRYRTDGMVIRDPGSKWFVPKQLWPDKYYNPYMVGPIHFTSRRLVEDIYGILQNSSLVEGFNNATNSSDKKKSVEHKRLSTDAFNSLCQPTNYGGVGGMMTEELYSIYRQRAYYYFEDVFLGHLIIQSQDGSHGAFRNQSVYSLWPEEKCRSDAMGIHGFNQSSMTEFHHCLQQQSTDSVDFCKCLK